MSDRTNNISGAKTVLAQRKAERELQAGQKNRKEDARITQRNIQETKSINQGLLEQHRSSGKRYGTSFVKNLTIPALGAAYGVEAAGYAEVARVVPRKFAPLTAFVFGAVASGASTHALGGTSLEVMGSAAIGGSFASAQTFRRNYSPLRLSNTLTAGGSALWGSAAMAEALERQKKG
jgi:hypothetical protein